MAARSESVRFDIIGNDRASDAFSRVGRAVSDAGGKMTATTTKADFLDDALKRQRRTAALTADATLALVKTDETLSDAMKVLAGDSLAASAGLARVKREADRLDGKTVNVKIDVDKSAWSRISGLFGGAGRGAGGGLMGLGSLGGQGLGAVPMAGGNPYAGAAVAAGAVASAPFLGQLAAGGIVAALGAGLAGLGIAGALITQKITGAKVSVQQLTAAQDRLNASQDRLNALQRSGKATSAQLAAAQASVASAQDHLNKLQAADATRKNLEAVYARQLKVQAAFKTLSDHAKDSLAVIGRSFVPVLLAIAQTADDVLHTLTPVFAGAVKAIAGPFREFADVFIRTFARADVKSSIQDVAKAFGSLLTAVTPVLGSAMGNVAVGIDKIARAVSANPQAFANFIEFFFQVVGAALTAIAWLTKVANYIEAHFKPAMHRVAVIFDGVRHEIAHTWDQIYENTVGTVIRFGHDVERDFNDFRHRTAVIFDGIRHDIAHYWDMTWNNTIGRIRRGVGDVVSWFKGLPGKALGALTGFGADLWGVGKRVIGSLWTGMKTVWNTVIGWARNLKNWFLDALGPFRSPPQWAVAAGKHIAQGLFGWMDTTKHRLITKASSLGAIVGAAAAGAIGGVGPYQRYAAGLLGGYGWGQGQLAPLIALWNRESGWNPAARNPSSGAAGIPQDITGNFHGGWQGQILWGLSYIAGRYGSPAAAWGHELSFGWYDRGGMLPPGLSLAYNGTGRPEPVGGGNTYNISVYVAPGADAETGRRIVAAIRQHEKRSGKSWRS